MSLSLDLLRFLAALAVTLGHLNQRFFSDGYEGMEHLATASVGFFFVLSGFVIAYTVDRRRASPREYAVARLARIYSVAVPALLLTFVLDSVGRSFNPAYYRFWSDDFAQPLKSGLASLLFLNEAHGQELRFMTNSPYWSLGFEVPYYVAFGVMVFARGWARWVLLALCLVVWGLPVLSLFPLWLAGVALYRVLQTSPVPKGAGSLALVAVPLFVLTAGPIKSLWEYGLKQASHSDSSPSRWFLAIYTGRSAQLPLLAVGGVITCCVILAVSAYREEISRWLQPLAPAIRNLASCTFSLYLCHFPILCFGASLPIYDRSPLHQAVLLAVTLAACYGLSRVTENRKAVWARGLDRLTPGRRIS